MTVTKKDPIEQIRAEIERIKGWQETFHAKEDERGFCDVCSCRWPCTEAEVAQDAGRMGRALELALSLAEHVSRCRVGDVPPYEEAEDTLSGIAAILSEEEK